VTIAALAGVCAGIAGWLFGHWSLAPLVAWDTAAVVYVVWIGRAVIFMDEKETARFASRQDPGRRVAEVLLLGACAASLVALGVVLVQAAHAKGVVKDLRVGLGVVSVVVSWCVVHTLFALRYARLYYNEPTGGIDFNGDEAPNYMDFAYLAFTIGMTFQVSDTSLTTREFRATALQHALWSYLFGTAIVATTVNLLAGLNK
jgi:uncharacterized membrane protein